MESNKKNSQAGVSLVEAALMMSIFIFVIFAGFGLAFKVRDNIIAQNLAGAGGQMVYRQCAFVLFDVALTGSGTFTDIINLVDCINDTKATLESFGPLVDRDIDVSISVFADPDWLDPTVNTYGTVLLVHRTTSVKGSQYTATDFTSGVLNNSFVGSGLAIVVETYVNNKFPLFGFGVGTSYEVSIT